MPRQVLSGNEYVAVQLAIEATGQQGLSSLEQQLLNTKAAIATMQGQLQAGGAITAKSVDDLAKLAAQQDRLQESVEAANRVIAGQPASLQATQASFGGATRAALELSRGLEDLTTG